MLLRGFRHKHHSVSTTKRFLVSILSPFIYFLYSLQCPCGFYETASLAPYSMAAEAIEDVAPQDSDTPLFRLPSELIDQILSHLDARSLSIVSRTCRSLWIHSKRDPLWQAIVQHYMPTIDLKSPTPCDNFEQLYYEFRDQWFLLKNKIWFGDNPAAGQVVITRFDHRTGHIEAYRLVAEREPPTMDFWEYDQGVVIHSFNPRLQLHLDDPVLKLERRSQHSLGQLEGLDAETIMPRANRDRGIFSSFFLTRALQPQYPMSSQAKLWPPMTIPSKERVRAESGQGFNGPGYRPSKVSEVSEQCFRIRRWMSFQSYSIPFSRSYSTESTRMGETVTTYSTLDPKLYTPTPEKPYRGIWVGDYAGHGCEFLLLHQPDDEDIPPLRKDKITQNLEISGKSAEIEPKDQCTHKGRIEMIKLTGDLNVPRGEHTFIADDISDSALVRIAEEPRFRGARIVRSRGQIAARGFQDSKFISSELILVSHDRIAQYWKEFGHISYFERVDFERFTRV
jgi:Cyclin D1 binding domain/F-box domain